MVTATIAIDTTDDEQPYGTATAARSANRFPAQTRPHKLRNRLASGPRRVVSPDGGGGGGRAQSSSGGFVNPRKNFSQSQLQYKSPVPEPGVVSRDPLSSAVVQQAAAVESLGQSHFQNARGWRSQELQQQQHEYHPGQQRSDPPSVAPAPTYVEPTPPTPFYPVTSAEYYLPLGADVSPQYYQPAPTLSFEHSTERGSAPPPSKQSHSTSFAAGTRDIFASPQPMDLAPPPVSASQLMPPVPPIEAVAGAVQSPPMDPVEESPSSSVASVAFVEEDVEAKPHQQQPAALPPSIPPAKASAEGPHKIRPASTTSKPKKSRRKDPDKPFFNSMETVRVKVLYVTHDDEFGECSTAAPGAEEETRGAQDNVFAEFEVTAKDVFRREKEMKRAAESYEVGVDRWGGSRIMLGMREILAIRKEVYAQSSDPNPAVESGNNVNGEGISVKLPGRADRSKMVEAHPFMLTFRPTKEEANWDARLLLPRLANYMSTGRLRVPKESTGNDVLLLLEYFAIFYNPARLSFDGFGSFLRLKLWSDYYGRRTDVANWVVQAIEGAAGRASMGFWFSTCPAEIQVGDGHHLICGGRKCELLDDGKGGIDAVHNFFNDDDPEAETALVSQLRSDFAKYVQLSLPGTAVTFRAQQVTLSGSASQETIRTSVLHVNFSEGGTSKIPRCIKNSMSLASKMSIVEFNAPVENVMTEMESDAVTVITWTGGQSVAENAFDIEKEYEERGMMPLGLTEESQGVEGRPPARSEVNSGTPSVKWAQYVPVVSPEKAGHDSPELVNVRCVSPEQSDNSLYVEGGSDESVRSGRSYNASTDLDKLRAQGQSGEPQGGVFPESEDLLCVSKRLSSNVTGQSGEPQGGISKRPSSNNVDGNGDVDGSNQDVKNKSDGDNSISSDPCSELNITHAYALRKNADNKENLSDGEAGNALNTDQNVKKNEQNSELKFEEESLYDRMYKSCFGKTKEDSSEASTLNSNVPSPPCGSLRELSEEVIIQTTQRKTSRIKADSSKKKKKKQQTLEEINSSWLKDMLGFI
mmetsp:Transcript_46878/g.91517  ORF Transcript_46878/g.91517 Transcript_46878/m.91517 type:complete len:1036 (+) Transcript_46878:67-3174(+)